MRHNKLYRMAIVLCAMSWFMVGLSVADVLDALGTVTGPSRLQLAVLALVGALGIGELVGLLRGTWQYAEPGIDAP